MSIYRVAIQIALQTSSQETDIMGELVRTREKLDESGLKWVKVYYWPGEHYCVLVQAEDENALTCLSELGLDIVEVSDLSAALARKKKSQHGGAVHRCQKDLESKYAISA